MGKPKVAAIIQARMGSTRLPGKVLMPLAGKPVLGHIIHRLRKCRTVDVIAIATSDMLCDDPLEEFACSEGIECVRGSENNVLQRYAKAATLLAPDVIIRVTGDAPLIDPTTIDCLVDKLLEENADYCVGDPNPPHTIHEGFCPLSRNALNRLLRDASDDPAAKEHVTAYIKEHPEKFKIVHIPNDPGHCIEDVRISVDTPSDMRFMEEIYRRLQVPAGEAEINDVVKLLRENPDILRINNHVHQKNAREKTRRILIRCDGSEKIGMGHAVRCLALAEELRDIHGFGITFAVNSGPVIEKMLSRSGFPFRIKPEQMDEADWIKDILTNLRFDAIVLDIRTDLSTDAVDCWRKNGLLTVALDDPSERRLKANLAIYPPVPQIENMDWKSFSGRRCVGWEYIPLRRSFSEPAQDPGGYPPLLLVSMGGSDPTGLVFTAIEALEKVTFDFRAILVVGGAFSQSEALSDRLAQTKCQIELVADVADMASIMRRADLALASFGMTAYELAAIGVPSVLISLSDDHASSAEALAKAGTARSLGVHTSLTTSAIAAAVDNLLNNPAERKIMRGNAQNILIGNGTRNIAAEIAQELETRP